MSWGHYLFSFKGRINRARYWFFILAAFIFYAAGIVIALPYIFLEHRSTADAGHAISALGIATICAEVVVVIALLVSVFAVYVKRLHDRDKGAWWIIPFSVIPSVLNAMTDARLPTHIQMPILVAVVLALISAGFSIWGFVEIGCLRGTAGPNRFGEDPLSI